MLRKIAKWTGIVLGSLLLLLVAGYFLIARNITQRIDKKYSFVDESLAIVSDSSAIRKGYHLAVIKGCTDCHGSNLGGRIMLEDDGLGRLVATNLTKGEGGLPHDYSTTDWVRSLRHGIDRSGRPLLFMPSHETTMLSEEDMSAIIAYCQQIPAVDNQLPASKIGPIVNVMTFFDKMPLLSVEKIDHKRPMIVKADTTEGVAMGKYLAVSCSGCHHADFKGGDPVAPGMPPVPNLTSTGDVGKWTQQQFINTLRTGKTPAGHQIDNENMPWKMTAQYEDKELASLYKFFRSLP